MDIVGYNKIIFSQLLNYFKVSKLYNYNKTGIHLPTNNQAFNICSRVITVDDKSILDSGAL